MKMLSAVETNLNDQVQNILKNTINSPYKIGFLGMFVPCKLCEFRVSSRQYLLVDKYLYSHHLSA